jgi:hypothetical protein
LLGAPVDWAVPYETVIAEAKLIRYWNGVEGWWRLIWRTRCGSFAGCRRSTGCAPMC